MTQTIITDLVKRVGTLEAQVKMFENKPIPNSNPEINASTTEEASEKQIKFLKDLGMKVEGKLTKFEAKMLIKEGLKKREKEKNDKMTKKTEDKSDIEILEETTDKLAKACSDKVNIPQQKTKPNNADSKSPSDTMDEFIKEEEEKTEEETYL